MQPQSAYVHTTATIKDQYTNDAVPWDLADLMVFLGGPRQVGDTTSALSLLPRRSDQSPTYLNSDYVDQPGEDSRQAAPTARPPDHRATTTSDHRFPSR